MEQKKVRVTHRIPLYQVLEKPLPLAELDAVLRSAISKDESVVEIKVGIGLTAVGIYNTVTKRPIRHLFTRCDYHQPPGHFVAIEEGEIERMFKHFPNRFRRVWGRYENPYT